MSISGLCQICESETAEHDCTRCGMLVCDTHYDTETQLCAQCASQAGSGSGEPPQTDRDTFQF